MKNPWVALVVLVLVGVLFTAPWALAQNSSTPSTNPNLSAISGSFTGPVATAGTMSAALFDGGNFRGVNADFSGTCGVGGTATFGGLLNAATVDAGTLVCQGNSTLKGTLGVAGTATFAGTVNASTVDAGVEVISPKHCVGATCGVNFTLSGATAVCNSSFQAPTVTCTGFCQSLGGFGNTGGAGDCVGALSSMCVNDPQGLAISNGSATTITMATDGGGSAIFSGAISTPLTDAGVLQLRTTTGNPTCGIGDAGLFEPNIGQYRFQPSTATEGTGWFCSGRGWIPYPAPFALSASFTSATSVTDFWISPPLVSPSGSPGPSGALSGCSLNITAAGSGGAGVTYSAVWHDGDGGTRRLCQIDLLCNAAAGTEILKPACDGDAGWGPSFGGTGFVALMRAEDGGTCGGFPSGSMACSYQFFTNTLPF